MSSVFRFGNDEILVEPYGVDVNSTRISVSPCVLPSSIPPALEYNRDPTQVVRWVDYSDPMGKTDLNEAQANPYVEERMNSPYRNKSDTAYDSSAVSEKQEWINC